MKALCWVVIIFMQCWMAFCCPDNCECVKRSDDFIGDLEIYCPKQDATRIKLLTENAKKIILDCTEKTVSSDFDLLDGLKIKPISLVFIRLCPLPSKTIASLLNNTQISLLVFSSYRNHSHHLTSLPFKHLNSLTKLELPHNGLTRLPTNLLTEPSNIADLTLYDNFISEIPKNFFLMMPNLTEIELGSNNLEQIDNNAFANLTKLKNLNLWKNKFKYFKGGEFNNLTKLYSLDINNNFLETLPSNIFNDLINLDTLILSLNQFITLPADLLKNTNRLRVLELNGNRNNLTLPNKFLAGLEFLEKIFLNENGMFELPKDIFDGSEFVKNISLSHNAIKELSFEIFNSQINLKFLDLSFNQISYLPDNILHNLLKLEHLNLGNNKLTKINRYLMKNLEKLKYLNVENNGLSVIDPYAFRQLSKLEEAHFSRNNLTLLNEENDSWGAQSPFHNSIKLKKLFLANNSLSEIFSDWRQLMLSLTFLDLSYNKYEFFQGADIQFLSQDVVVNLKFNKIKMIDLVSYKFITTDPMKKYVPRIYLADNPLMCDCSAFTLWQYANFKMASGAYGVVRLEFDGLNCAGPPSLAGRPFLKVESQELTCKVSKDCPEPCQCSFRPTDTALLVNCSSQALTQVPETFPVIRRSSHIELILEDNLLTNLPNATSRTFENVTHLYLSHNQLTRLDSAILSKKLRVLTIDHNNLTHFTSSVISKLSDNSSLNLVTLHGNPWACDCENRDFLAWLQKRFKLVPFLGNVTCTNGKVVNNLSASDLCPAPLALVLFCSTVAAAGIIIGMMAALYYRYQQNIHVWLYAHQCCLWWVTEEELDRDKRYDVFVSFSQKDADFVVKQIVPQLEEQGLKLCLHYRDWIAGEWIPNQIARSVEDSRRTLVVLSPNFLESVWGAMEFRTAHKQALSEGRARVVMLLYGDLPPTEELHVELKAYISLNTYVKWGDPWFWNKLRYALPHRPLPSVKKGKTSDKLELISTNLIANVPTTPPITTSPNLSNMLQTPTEFSSAALC